jgi:hypothetical protein
MPPAPPAATPKKGLALPGSPAVWIGVLVVALAGGAYLLWRRSQSSSAAADTSGTTATDAADTTDEDAGEFGTLQSEIGDLQSSDAQNPPKVQVPNVVGKTQATAFGIISSAGLKPAGAAVQPGKTLTVTAQSPGAGALADRGSTVSLQSSVKAAPKPAAKPPAKKPAPKKTPPVVTRK